MTVFDAFIQGVVQGLTEFLPVSSSGHLTITQHILGVGEDNLFFSVMLHIGTLVAVCAFYHRLLRRLIVEFFRMIRDIFTGRFRFREMSHDRRMIVMLIIGLLPLFLLFVPIPGTDLKVKDLADLFTSARYFIVVGISLLMTSVLLLLGDIRNRSLRDSAMKHAVLSENGAGRTEMNVVDALVVGIVQCCAAVLPGLSRSGSTLSAGEMRGVNRQTAFDYTFVIAIPSIIAAAVLECKDALSSPGGLSVGVVPIVVGMVTAAVVGYLSIVLFKWLLKTDKMFVFILYTAVVGIAVIVVSIIEMHTGVNLFTAVPLT